MDFWQQPINMFFNILQNVERCRVTLFVYIKMFRKQFNEPFCYFQYLLFLSKLDNNNYSNILSELQGSAASIRELPTDANSTLKKRSSHASGRHAQYWLTTTKNSNARK